jgi:hypothetical protein
MLGRARAQRKGTHRQGATGFGAS